MFFKQREADTANKKVVEVSLPAFGSGCFEDYVVGEHCDRVVSAIRQAMYSLWDGATARVIFHYDDKGTTTDADIELSAVNSIKSGGKEKINFLFDCYEKLYERRCTVTVRSRLCFLSPAAQEARNAQFL